MNFNKKDLIVGTLVVALIVGGLYLYYNLKKPKDDLKVTPKTSEQVKKEIEDKFKLNIPDDKYFIELKDVSGGDATGIATDTEILADLPELSDSEFYQAWLVGENMTSLGKMWQAKGGWLVEYNKSKYKDINKVIVTRETKMDQTSEVVVLEGSF